MPRIALASDAPLAQHRRLVAERADFVELVADVEDAAAFGGELSQRFEQPVDGLWRQHRRRLVHDEQSRVLQQAAHNLDTLALAGGQRIDGTMRVERKAVPRRYGANARGQVGAAAARFECQRNVLAHGQCLEQRKVLEHHADAKTPRVSRAGDGDFATLPEDRPFICLDDAVDDLHQRRLARAVLAEHCVNFPGQHVEVDAFVGDDRRIGFGDAGQPQPRHQIGIGVGQCCGKHAGDRWISGAERAFILPVSSDERMQRAASGVVIADADPNEKGPLAGALSGNGWPFGYFLEAFVTAASSGSACLLVAVCRIRMSGGSTSLP